MRVAGWRPEDPETDSAGVPHVGMPHPADPAPRTPHPDNGAQRAHGEVHVVSRVVGFKKIKFYTNENIGSGELDLPEQQMHTTSYWLTIPSATIQALPYGGDDRRDGVIGLAFAMKNVAQLLLMCDGHDIGLSVDGGSLDRSARTRGAGSLVPPKQREGGPDALAAEPNVFIYDNYPGGIGFSRPLFEMHDLLLERTQDLINGCACGSGCPSCVGPEGNTGPYAKEVASLILLHLRSREVVHAQRAPSAPSELSGGREEIVF